jgi:hypothetical protein
MMTGSVEWERRMTHFHRDEHERETEKNHYPKTPKRSRLKNGDPELGSKEVAT